MLNIIDSDLEKRIRNITKGKDMALVLSSLNEMVHGYYSAKEPKIPTIVPQISYNNQDFTPVEIARIMSDKNYDYKLEKLGLTPFSTFKSSYPNKQGLDFRLILIGEIKFDNIIDISDLLEETWKKNTDYSMNLEFDKQFGKIF